MARGDNDRLLTEAIVAARPRIMAALATQFRDLDLAEEGFAEACERLVAHGDGGLPDNVGAWLRVVAQRHIVDRLRHAARSASVIDALRHEAEEAVMPTVELLDEPIADERLRLIFICCHPAIASDIRAALTLRIVCGVPTGTIARGFLVEEATMYQRLTRAKAKIAKARIAFETPSPEHWDERLASVLTTLEIGYALAYQDAAGTSAAAVLGPEMLRLATMLAELLPDNAEILALAALIVLAQSRQGARLGRDGTMIPLSQQDPRLWDDRLIVHGVHLLDRAARLGRSGPLQIMASIHLTHARRRFGEGDTDTILLKLYDQLFQLRPTDTVAIDRAIVVARVEGPEAALALLDRLDSAATRRYRPFHAARALCLAELERKSEARTAYAHALALAPPEAERLLLEKRRAALGVDIT